MPDMIKLTGLWEHEARKSGNIYLAGNFSPGIKLLLFKNGYKKMGDNRPDWIAYLAPAESTLEKEEEPRGPVTDDEIPF